MIVKLTTRLEDNKIPTNLRKTSRYFWSDKRRYR